MRLIFKTYVVGIETLVPLWDLCKLNWHTNFFCSFSRDRTHRENRELSGKMALVRNVREKSGKNIFITKPGKVGEFRILRSFQIPVKIRKFKHQRTLNLKCYAKSKFHFHPWFHLFLMIVEYKKSQKSVGRQIWSKDEDREWSWRSQRSFTFFRSRSTFFGRSSSCQDYTLAFQVLWISCFIVGKSFFY